MQGFLVVFSQTDASGLSGTVRVRERSIVNFTRDKSSLNQTCKGYISKDIISWIYILFEDI